MATDTLDKEAQRAAPLNWATKTVLICSGIPGALAFMAISSVLPKIQEALAHGPGDAMLVKQLLGVVGFAMLFGAPLAWPLIRAIGFRAVMIGVMLVIAAAGSTGLYLDSLWALMPFRLILGLAAAISQVAAFTYINTRMIGNDRAKYMGWHISMAMGCTIPLHWIAGTLGDQNWRLPFALYFLAIIPALIALKMQDWHGEGATTARRSYSVSEVLRWFPYRFLLLGVCVGMCAFAPSMYIAFIAKSHGFAAPSQTAFIQMAASCVGAVTALLYGQARKWASGVQALLFNFGLSCVGAVIVAYATTYGALLTGMCVYSLGVGWGVPNLMNILSTKVEEEQQPIATGWTKAIHYLSAPFAPIIVERVSHAYGPVGAMWLVAAISAFVVVWALVMPRAWNSR